MTADRVRIRLEPAGAEFEIPRGGSLVANLAAHGVEFPCGGMGECGRCEVRLISGTLPVTEADRAAFSEKSIDAGWRLACQARADGALVLECGQSQMEILAGSGKGSTFGAIDAFTTSKPGWMFFSLPPFRRASTMRVCRP